MNALVLASRFPWPVHSGDRLRTVIWLEALAGHAGVMLVAPEGAVPPEFAHVRHIVLRASTGSLLARSMRVLREDLPRQTLLAASYDWDGALARASRAAEESAAAATPHSGRTAGATHFDTAVVLLSRCDPWLRDRLPARRRILDAVDAMSVSAAQRGLAGAFPGMPFWERERVRSERFESSASAGWDAVVVVNEAERSLFGTRVEVIPNGVEILPEREGERPFDFGFWGNLAYFANRDAVRLLLREIWPAIRGRAPGAKLLIAGSDAPPSLLRHHGRDGVTIVSPMTDRPALLRRVKVALIPLRFGSGVSNKIAEAAEASCALAGTRIAFRGFEDLAERQVVEDDPATLAARCASLVGEGSDWRTIGAIARNRVTAAHDRRWILKRLASAALRASLPFETNG